MIKKPNKINLERVWIRLIRPGQEKRRFWRKRLTKWRKMKNINFNFTKTGVRKSKLLKERKEKN